MIAKITCVLLILFAFSRADDIVDSIDLKTEILDAQKKVEALNETSIIDVNETNRKFTEIVEYIKTTRDTYIISAENLFNESLIQLTNISNVFFGNAIDKGKPVSTFNCLLKATEDTEKALCNSLKTTKDCIRNINNKILNELVALQNQLQFIQTATLGLYDVIFNSLFNCTNSREISQLILKAEMRENNLKKLLREYSGKGSDLRIQFNEGQLNCLTSATGSIENILNTCKNKMKAC